MAHEIIKNGIIGSIETLVEMAATVTTSGDQIHQLDIDLLLEQIRKLYREVQILDEENKKFMITSGANLRQEYAAQQRPVVEKQVSPTQPVVEPVQEIKPELVEESKNEEVAISPVAEVVFTESILVEESTIDNHQTIIPEPIVEPVVFNNPEPIIEVAPEPIKAPVENSVETKTEVDPNLAPVTLAEKFQKEDRSINQQMKDRQQGLNQKMNESPVSNLKTAIGINDKFMFVNELFKGEMKEYDSMIGEVNNAPNLDSALGRLYESLHRFGTADKTDAILKIERFIQRRFM